MLRHFDDDAYLGLFGKTISKELVNFDGEIASGDVLKSKCDTITLWFTGTGYRIFSNDSRHYILAKDLKQPFRKL